MRKLLLRNSIFILSASLLILGSCKAKQQKAVVKKEEEKENAKPQGERINPEEEVIIHRPGTLNQKYLDSIKAVKKTQKRRPKKD